MDLGEAIRWRRTELGMSQDGLAKAADVDARQIRRYEAGEQQPLFTVAVAIAAALGIRLAKLAGMPAEPAAGRAGYCPASGTGSSSCKAVRTPASVRIALAGGAFEPQRDCFRAGLSRVAARMTPPRS